MSVPLKEYYCSLTPNSMWVARWTDGMDGMDGYGWMNGWLLDTEWFGLKMRTRFSPL